MKDLVQKLREASEFECAECSLHYVTSDFKSESRRCSEATCAECVADSFNALADRIEREYDPKPEPDTVEKVALDMLDTFVKSAEACEKEYVRIFISHECPDGYRKRLEALGVKVDD